MGQVQCLPTKNSYRIAKADKQIKIKHARGAWVAQSVELPTLAQVTISRFGALSPTSGSVLTAQSLEPALDSVSPSLSLCPSPAHAQPLSFSLSLSQK